MFYRGTEGEHNRENIREKLGNDSVFIKKITVILKDLFCDEHNDGIVFFKRVDYTTPFLYQIVFCKKYKRAAD